MKKQDRPGNPEPEIILGIIQQSNFALTINRIADLLQADRQHVANVVKVLRDCGQLEAFTDGDHKGAELWVYPAGKARRKPPKNDLLTDMLKMKKEFAETVQDLEKMRSDLGVYLDRARYVRDRLGYLVNEAERAGADHD